MQTVYMFVILLSTRDFRRNILRKTLSINVASVFYSFCFTAMPSRPKLLTYIIVYVTILTDVHLEECLMKDSMILMLFGILITTLLFFFLVRHIPSRYPFAEVAADVGCYRIVIGVDGQGHEVKVPCVGEWKEAYESSSLPIRHIAPLWMSNGHSPHPAVLP
ncbi:MAG: hypothetical protein A3C80_02265 [Candidatus Ryanbacteria bacterium RIFCSPHIGHO2_02_FULL_45_43]|uniref:Uncharacterized protein n=1 Tax=Candidatus Ryanbacteria bacterium RIFCSPHIGHO2_01_45_13 TaxID=1802112 RepID=A0A1G2FXT9_9BACT|nr:MAG: hypothetical protein A2W41_03540 [Candidatus Ryanbacteria bacterium RIFCSPHIGHO2_01_45_13]OGZ48447.1 MAG: hypothetical protein A3C80_02265 [Candidatus Ryanbacteria bacterium RIFCSPHIGHO2_02_FULL_45_43]OGZ50312.1 MAG: hypothetical protein A3E55_00165 [Candidatus Ryanbacteria bacterium RIFCSPHIGHO2_12_FULL_44_20]OGZ51651.1 MAG: hypothetical protein A3A17_02615 [Candidatus Ryanbacteria bacterium RIFCSPLOWO2_01_FULL_44_230]OGZ54589.1 MAG: hypothetical protein A3H62_00165 [Candidatus Ryanbac